MGRERERERRQMAKDGWTAIRIPNELHKRIKQILEDEDKYGYHTVSGFVTTVVRDALKELDDETPKDEE